VSELGGLLLVAGGLGALAAMGALIACCLGLRSPVEFVLATYLVAWGWLVAASLALSPWRVLTTGSLLAALAAGLALALAAWLRSGRPSPQAFRPSIVRVRDSLRSPTVLILAVAVGLGTAYIAALAFLTPANDWDALTYHLARAAFWKQEHGVVLIENTADSRLNVNPPNAEIGQLATMLLSGTDRYAALPQLLAYAALALSVAGLARRIGLSTEEAMFAALAFATLPVVALQATGALNDLVVASFLVSGVFYALGSGRGSLALVALAVALAVGVKFSGLVALPTLVVVVAIASPVRRWAALALAGVTGVAAGSVWYIVNAIETGELDGGASEETDQRAEASAAGTVTRGLRLALSFVDMPGAARPAWAVFVVAAVTIAIVAAAAALARRPRRQAVGALVVAAIVASVATAPLVWGLGERFVYRVGLALDQRDLLVTLSWELNTKADPTRAWYGPLAPVLLLAATALVVVAWRRGTLPYAALAFVSAPWLLLGTLALLLNWDPWRGRFLVFGVALAAATWGLLLRRPILGNAAAGIGAIALFLTLANYEGKWSGLFFEPTIWGNPRWEAQTRLSGPRHVHRFVEENVPADARIGVALTGNDHLHPYFGQSLSRNVSLVSGPDADPPADVEWLVLAPGTDVRRCPGAWRPDHAEGGWTVERRLKPDGCLGG
jgi:hypothetical protein